MPGRLPTELWIKAHAARCSARGDPLVIVHRGDPHRGVVVVKLHLIDAGFRVIGQARDLDGRLIWTPALEGRVVPEPEADAYIERQVSYDPDVWVVEIQLREDDGWFSGVVD